MKHFLRIFTIIILCVVSVNAQQTQSLIDISLNNFDIPNYSGSVEPVQLRLGIYTAEVTIQKEAIPKGFPEDLKGFRVWHVMPLMTGDKADIFEDDTIIGIDGKVLYDANFRGDDFVDIYLSTKKAGEKIKISVLKSGLAIDKEVEIVGITQVPMAYLDPGIGSIKEHSWLSKIIEQYKLSSEINSIQRQMASVANSDFNKISFGNRPNPWRLNAVTYLHNHPTRIGAYSRLITDELWSANNENGNLNPVIQTISKHLGIKQIDYEILTYKPQDINQLADYFVKAQMATDIAYNKVEDLQSTIKKLKDILLTDIDSSQDEKLKSLSKEGKRDYRRQNDIEQAKLFDNADKADLFALVDASKMMINLIDTIWINDFISRLSKEPITKKVDGVEGDVLYYWENDYGRYVIGGAGSNRYTGDFAMILDIGGNDQYELPISKPGTSRMVIDVKGNDLYQSETGQGAGIGCIDVLFDMNGNDTYRGKNYSQGAGLLGIGVLADYNGNDVYTSEFCSQGAAFLGIGLLYDKYGMDIYDSYVYSQGFGYCKGFGALMDENGNDSYKAGWKITDSRDPKRAHLSMSQGFGYGMRPWASAIGADGGIGVLTDFNGHDVYNADFFSQGGSYWFALGVLHDYHGCDRYTAGQYSQGSGIHLSFGALLDDEGNDMYDAYAGLEQGNSHDWSSGCLEDAEGDDTYRGNSSSQGSALTVGIAWLMDMQGNDMYICNKNDTTYSQGGGREQKTRKASSFGILMDLGKGSDVYTEPRVKPGEAVLKGQKGVIYDDGEKKEK